MVLKKKEHSNDLRTLIIRHYQNGDSLSEIAAKTLLSRSTVQYMVDKSINQQSVLVIYSDVLAKGKQQQRQLDLFNVSSSLINENQLPRYRLRSRMNYEFHCTLIQFENGHTKLECLDESLMRSLT